MIKTFFNETYKNANNGAEMNPNDLRALWSLINAALPLGGIVGAMISGLIADRFGRKKGLFYVNAIVILTGALFVMSKYISSYFTLVAGRALGGLYSGLFTGILPIFLNEISPSNLRGAVGTVNQLVVVIGILSANILGLKQILGSAELWPLLTGGVFFGAIFNFALILFQESPKFLYNKEPELARKGKL